jgi:hypothetical protein
MTLTVLNPSPTAWHSFNQDSARLRSERELFNISKNSRTMSLKQELNDKIIACKIIVCSFYEEQHSTFRTLD